LAVVQIHIREAIRNLTEATSSMSMAELVAIGQSIEEQLENQKEWQRAFSVSERRKFRDQIREAAHSDEPETIRKESIVNYMTKGAESLSLGASRLREFDAAAKALLEMTPMVGKSQEQLNNDSQLTDSVENLIATLALQRMDATTALETILTDRSVAGMLRDYIT